MLAKPSEAPRSVANAGEAPRMLAKRRAYRAKTGEAGRLH
jgi:hypothetical protein